MNRLAYTSGNSRMLLRTVTAALSTLTFLAYGAPTARPDVHPGDGARSRGAHTFLNVRQPSEAGASLPCGGAKDSRPATLHA
ncbi:MULTISPECIES: hypothetical protein [unclassified Streptomyces]|uniref:hypothetical protein n=1 Tax=unclassified Streptomyces TaxID=2593676 RepID=UPI0036E526A7